MIINFSIIQIKYLKAFFSKEKPTLFLEMEMGKINETIYKLDEDLMDEIREWAIQKLQIVGFDKNYNLNQDGEILEGLVDLFHT